MKNDLIDNLIIAFIFLVLVGLILGVDALYAHFAYHDMSCMIAQCRKMK